jgi:cobaltochelatase CobT
MPEDNKSAFERSLIAATRAIAGADCVSVQIATERALIAADRIQLPAKRIQRAEDAILSRGAADALALRLRMHDASKHSAYTPDTQKGRLAFDAVERSRIEAVGSRGLEGVAANLEAGLIEECTRKGYGRMEDRQDAPISEALAFVIRERLTGRALPKIAAGIANLWRDEIMAKASSSLARLDEMAADQTAFAEALRQVLRDLDLTDEGTLDPGDETEEAPPDEAENPSSADEPSKADDASPDDQTSQRDDEESTSEQESEAARPEEFRQDPNAEPFDFSESAPAPLRRNHSVGEQSDAYRIFTRDYDEELSADLLADVEELDRLRQFFDQQAKQFDALITRLANRLQRQLMARQTRNWAFDLEEGVLDTARLTRVVIDPSAPLSFKQESETAFRDTVVSLLIDNSGSMRGRPIMIAALCADVLARTLERCGVKVEILGFTTKAWKGGRARDAWVKAGRPKAPGRLNDLRHILYKAADAPYRRVRRNLGLMLREGMLKENIDGEALIWAWKRLSMRPEQRRILMVISDGAPVDDATLTANSTGYLDKHLREVIAEIESRSEVELCAIGIGHDVTRWYQRAVTIKDVNDLASAMVEQLGELFAERLRSS